MIAPLSFVIKSLKLNILNLRENRVPRAILHHTIDLVFNFIVPQIEFAPGVYTAFNVHAKKKTHLRLSKK